MRSSSRTMRGVVAVIVVTSIALVSITAGVVAQATKGGNPKAAAVKNPVPPTPSSIDRGRQAYMRTCRQCHGPKGLGDGPIAPRTGGEA